MQSGKIKPDQLKLLRLHEQKPSDPFEKEAGGIAFHVDALLKGFVSIWIDLPRERMQIEPLLRRRKDEDVIRARLKAQRLLRLHAQALLMIIP